MTLNQFMRQVFIVVCLMGFLFVEAEPESYQQDTSRVTGEAFFVKPVIITLSRNPDPKKKVLSEAQVIQKPGITSTIVPDTIPISTPPKILVSGSNGLEKVKSAPVRPTAQLLKWPQNERASRPRFKDQGTRNIGFLDVDQGMPSSYVWSIAQDSLDMMWFGHYGGGVSRYDGESFWNWTEEHGLSTNYVQSVIADSKGHLWIGTENGVNRFNGDSLYHYGTKNGLAHDKVWWLFEDSEGYIWIGTQAGLNRLDPDQNTIELFAEEHGLVNNVVWGITEDRKGHIWVVTEGGVSKLDIGAGSGDAANELPTFTNYTTEQGLPEANIWSVLEDQYGDIWLGTNSYGVVRYMQDKNIFINYHTDNGLASDWIWSLKEDSKGNIWMGTYGKGIIKYSTGEKGESTFTTYGEEEGLTNRYIMSLFEDEVGNIWMGTDGAGVNKLDETRGILFHPSQSNGLSSRFMQTIFSDSRDRLWLGLEAGGIDIFYTSDFSEGPATTKHINAKTGLQNDIVWCLLEDQEGIFWMGTDAGLTSLDFSVSENGIATTYTAEQGLSDNSIWTITKSQDGSIWLGTEHAGVSKFDPEKEVLQHYGPDQGLPEYSIMASLVDRHGVFWFGTYGGGLGRLVEQDNGSMITLYGEKEGLQSDLITYLFEDSHGMVWMGTEGEGVYVFDPRPQEVSFDRITSEHGLSNNYIWSVIEDRNGNIWVGTEDEINVLRPLDANKPVTKENCEILHIGTKEGMKTPDVYSAAVTMDSEGRIWWGTGKGPMLMDPQKLIKPNTRPGVRLTSLTVGDRDLDFRSILSDTAFSDPASSEFFAGTYSGVTPFFNLPQDLVLPFDQNFLTFNFSAVDWSSTRNPEFQYYLSGWEENWQQWTDNGLVRYSNLPSGRYTLHLRARSVFGLTSDSYQYTFSIKPPWWKTWWALSIQVMGVVAFVMGLVKWRTHRLEERKRELEQKVEERTQALQASLEEIVRTRNQLVLSEKMASIGMLSAGIAHELSSPIAAIANGSKILKEDIKGVVELIGKMEATSKTKRNGELIRSLDELKSMYEYDVIVDEIRNNLKSIQLGASHTTNIIREPQQFLKA